MNDEDIVSLYWRRSENAIAETQNKYGKYCRSIAMRILYSDCDAEECENSVYLYAWNSIPPQKPKCFKAYIGAMARNLALNRYDYNKAAKRRHESAVILDEYYECLPDNNAWAENDTALKDLLDRFLYLLPQKTRVIFVRRYWLFYSVKEIASVFNMSQSAVKSILHRTRKKLKVFLEQEGVYL